MGLHVPKVKAEVVSYLSMHDSFYKIVPLCDHSKGNGPCYEISHYILLGHLIILDADKVHVAIL